jgi:hypothetical protein
MSTVDPISPDQVSTPNRAIWKRRDDACWRRTLDAVILLPKVADEPVMLPDTGAAVWDLLAEPTTLDDLVGTLSDVYSADPQTVERDVGALLLELEAHAVIFRLGVTGDTDTGRR